MSVWGITTRRSSSASECVVNLDQTLTRLASTKKTPPGRGRIGFCCLATQSHLFFWGGGGLTATICHFFHFFFLDMQKERTGLAWVQQVLACNAYRNDKEQRPTSLHHHRPATQPHPSSSGIPVEIAHKQRHTRITTRHHLAVASQNTDITAVLNIRCWEHCIPLFLASVLGTSSSSWTC